MEMKQLYSEYTTIAQKLLLTRLAECEAKGRTSSVDMRFINEGLVALDKVLLCPILKPHDRVILEKTYRYASDVVHGNLNYFSNYYYAYAHITKGDIDAQQNSFRKVNAATSTMLTTILDYKRHICQIGGSTDDYFVERMPRVLWAISSIKKKNLRDMKSRRFQSGFTNSEIQNNIQ
jgi:hypothetical protein